MILTTSWDDGHPLDEKIAELLAEFDLPGTFFIPIINREQRPVLDQRAIKSLDLEFEIGSHTLDHMYLTALSSKECQHQVTAGKTLLEQIVGHPVDGFCYPGGHFNESVKKIVSDAGFKYARTTENLCFNMNSDPFRIPTTLQFYPHKRPVFLRNYLRYGSYSSKVSVLRLMLSSSNFYTSLYDLLYESSLTDRIIHIWGHSWEIEEYNLWGELRNFFKLIASINPRKLTLNNLIKEKYFAGIL